MRQAPPHSLEHSEPITPLKLIFAEHNIEDVLCKRPVQFRFPGNLMHHGAWEAFPQAVYKAFAVIRIVIDEQKP
jgi:hypothetical protein